MPFCFQQMTRAMYQNKRMALLPSIDDPKGSPFLSPTPKPKVKYPLTRYTLIKDQYGYWVIKLEGYCIIFNLQKLQVLFPLMCCVLEGILFCESENRPKLRSFIL